METIGGYQLSREIGGWETHWFVWSGHKIDDPKKAEVVIKTCLVADLPPNPPGLPAGTPAFIVAAQYQKEAADKSKTIAPILACNIEKDRVYSVSPRYKLSLERLIESKVNLSDDALEHITSSILDSLGNLQKIRQHSHGNLKPSNVFLEGSTKNLEKARIILADLSADTSLGPAQDIHALGHTLHQLIRKRSLKDSFYPLQLSEEWSDLGSDAPKWLHLCNRFLDPALAQQPDPLKAAAAALRTAGRDSAGGTVKETKATLKKIGTSKVLHSFIWVGLLLALAAGGFFFIRHRLFNPEAAWQKVHTEHRTWLASISAELADPQKAATWQSPANPRLRFVSEKITTFLRESPTTALAITQNPLPPAYDPQKDAADPYRLQGNKEDPDTVRKLGDDLDGLRSSLLDYLPSADRERLATFQRSLTPLAGRGWPNPPALAHALAFDPQQENTLGPAISSTLPLVPLLLTGDTLSLLTNITDSTPLVLAQKDALLDAYIESTRERFITLFTEPIQEKLWDTNAPSSREIWSHLRNRANGLATLSTFLKDKTDKIASARFGEPSDNLFLLSFPEIDADNFANLWIKAAEQYLILPETVRAEWKGQWEKASQNRQNIDYLQTAFQQILERPVLVRLDEASFDSLLGQLSSADLFAADAPPANASPTPDSTNPANPANPGPATSPTAAQPGYRALLEKTLAALQTAAPADIPALGRLFLTDAAQFNSTPGAQNFLDQLGIQLSRSSTGWRPAGITGATRPNPADASLFNIPLSGRGAFPFRLINPPGGRPFFLGVWEVPIVLLAPEDLDLKLAEGPRYWTLAGGRLAPQPIPIWAALQREMVGPAGPVAPYSVPAAVAIPGGPQNWQRLPANFITPAKAVAVAARYGLRLPTLEEWRAAYSLPGNDSKGWVRGVAWRKQMDHIVSTVGERLKATWREGVVPTYPDVFPNTKAYGSFDVSKINDYDRDAAQASLYFRPTFTAQNPANVQDLRGNVSEIVTNGTRFSVCGPSALSSPGFGGADGPASLIPAEGAFSDVGFRFAINAEPDNAIADLPQLFATEIARLAP